MITIEERLSEIHAAIAETIAGSRKAPKPSTPLTPGTEWPLWASALKLLKTDSDAGLGDTLARVIGPIGGDAYKAWYLKTFGKPCGCSDRQESLNQHYPY